MTNHVIPLSTVRRALHYAWCKSVGHAYCKLAILATAVSKPVP